MIPDLSHIFARYEALVAETDALFTHIKTNFSDCVTCEQGCSDCCHAVFDLSLVEAMYLNQTFLEKVPYGKERSDTLMRAADLDRITTRIKKDFYKAAKDGKDTTEIMHEAARLRMPCPLLNAENSCIIYDKRPITCRLYGIPLNINGEGHVCGKNAFSKGGQYPTVNLATIQKRLDDLSMEIAITVKSRFSELNQVFVPVSMALLNKYDAQYLGIGPAKKEA